MINKILIKEALLGLVILAAGLVGFNALGINVKVQWVVFSIVLTIFFMAGTNILKSLHNRWPGQVGLIFAIITLINQGVFLILLFVFLEPGEAKHRILAIVGVITYLLFLGIDTYWKLKLLISSTPGNKNQNDK